MRLLLNIIWFVLCGLWMAIGYAFAALICFKLIPISLMPLGREIVSIDNPNGRSFGVAS
jgi:uncharacterized membrane protein YccF (DUF307 family)